MTAAGEVPPPRTVDLVQVDAFTSTPFAGNPAAVCVLDAYPADAWLQSVAREMNLSETAFLRRSTDGWDLRWFTPAAEVDLCGHATLAAAHVLLEDGLDDGPALEFATLSGRLGAERDGGWIVLDFPAEPPSAGDPAPGLLEALGLAPEEVAYAGRNRLDELVVIEDPARLRSIAPAMPDLARLGMRGAIVSSPSDREDADFLSRYFAPAFGVPEDPVTGSTHCCLGPYWAGRLGRATVVGYQASARGGIVRVETGTDRVRLGGEAVTILRARLTT
ncbi:MAG TPA: PhzF family phenazine biosynthesis protein [Longimicrobiales bacterium]|nr:PhzF family phenazine biosynthesis protein [Longimicrobiales bacterium]